MKRAGLSLSAMIAASSIAGCAHTDMTRLPPELREQGRLRKDECDRLDRALAPSRDRSGNLSVLGLGIGGRDAVISSTSARDQYLVGLLNLTTQCRRWQRFDITAEEYRTAQAQLAAAVTSTVDAAAVDQTLARLADAIAAAHGTSQLNGDELRQLFQEWSRNAPVSGVDPAIETRLARIEQILTERTRPSDGTVPPLSRQTWRVRFAHGSSQVDGATTSNLAANLGQAVRNCASGAITVVGYADLSGPPVRNLSLALDRARAVSAILPASGSWSTTVTSAGSTSSFGSDPASNRIVVVEALCLSPQ